jgi:hypothetical protein
LTPINQGGVLRAPLGFSAYVRDAGACARALNEFQTP